MCNTKHVLLSLDTARIMYKSEDKSLVKFALDNFTKQELEAKELPKTWEELGKLEGYYINNNGNILKLDIKKHDTTTNKNNKDVFPSKEYAEAALALAQLLQLREVYNNGWKHDVHNKPNEQIFVIRNRFCEANLDAFGAGSSSNFILVFNSQTIAKQFFENFKDLINQALPLL